MNRRTRDVRSCLFAAATFAMALMAMPAMAHLGQAPACEPCTQGEPLKGAIFTTLSDGSRVNANIYEALEDVYLDGGPGNQAPSSAAALPPGCYYFQVTDPPGKTLLSTDPVKCRQIHVNEDGVIDWVYASTQEEKVRGSLDQVVCRHEFEDDLDHHDVDAHTVQLFPYKKTPNPGGVYKVWITRVCDFVGDPNAEDPEDNTDFFWGFKPSQSKTDNYKVRPRKPSVKIHVHKFEDLNCNGVLDQGEPEIADWMVEVMKPLGDTSTMLTPFWIDPADVGDWKFTEEDRDHWFPTGLIIDDVYQSEPFNMATVTVTGDRGELDHTVIFLNAQLGDLKVCKQYDRDQDGNPDSPPVPVAGWLFMVEGGNLTSPLFGETDGTGCVDFLDLKPGSYKVTELFPDDPNWCPSGATMQNVNVPSGDTATVTFFNFCKGEAIMHTKGFWQNQGCSIIDAHPEYLTFLNTLAPYQGPLDIFTHGQDNCVGEHCPTITTLPFNNAGELGCYIVAPNSQPEDPNIGLAQQLAAFTLNALHFMGDVNTCFWFNSDPNDPGMGTKYVASDLIALAVTAWESDNAEDIQFYQNLLDAINNAGTVVVIEPTPCPVEYSS